MQTFSSRSGLGSRDCSPNERIAPAFPGIATAGGRGRRARAARRDAGGQRPPASCFAAAGPALPAPLLQNRRPRPPAPWATASPYGPALPGKAGGKLHGRRANGPPVLRGDRQGDAAGEGPLLSYGPAYREYAIALDVLPKRQKAHGKPWNLLPAPAGESEGRKMVGGIVIGREWGLPNMAGMTSLVD